MIWELVSARPMESNIRAHWAATMQAVTSEAWLCDRSCNAEGRRFLNQKRDFIGLGILSIECC